MLVWAEFRLPIIERIPKWSLSTRNHSRTSRRAAESGSRGSLAQRLTVLAAAVNQPEGKKESKIRSGHYYGKKNHLQEHILPHIALYKLDVKTGLN